MMKSITITGLSEQEAQARLRAEGYNELPSDRGRSFGKIIFEVFREPMFGMLLAAGGIYFIIGSWHEAAFLSLFATFSVAITIVQEVRSENVLNALRNLTSPRALVLRDGIQKRIPGRDVVRGDLVFLNEGDRVPADGYLIEGNDMMVDESLLTGESVPVRKRPDVTLSFPPNKPGGDDLPNIFSGSLVVRGYGKAVVSLTGLHSQIGQIGIALQSIEAESPHLQKETGRIVRVFGVMCFILSTTAIFAYGLLRGSWIDALLGGIALGMSLLPEEFPLVLTVFMVMGAWRISKAHVLTRRASAIETLGSATILCTDKTGTLTENKMSVVAFDAGGEPGSVDALLRTAILASNPETFDPMDSAIFACAKQNKVSVSAPVLLHQYGLKPDLLAVTRIIKMPDGSFVVASKGAPEAIAGLCHMSKEAQKDVHDRVRVLAQRGIRVLGVAEAITEAATSSFPESPREFQFRFLGLVGFADPLRKNAQASVEECRRAGIRVVMITGDYPETARAIAAEAGIIKQDGLILSGDELAGMSDHDLEVKCQSITVFARIMPDQKLRIVNALKANGEIVAMTGDGVNDAPALKAAHIGIAMGQRGTDVAREASSIVLLDDDFSSIVRTIRLGRRIYDNLQKAMTYIIAVHVPIAGLAMLPIFFGFPLILTPLLIALMEMVIDPVCSIVLEAEEEESNVMSRPPRDPKTSLLPARMVAWGAFQGAMALLSSGGIFFYARYQGLQENACRSLAFLALMACNFALIFINRSYTTSIVTIFRRHNPMLLGSVIIVPAILSMLFVINGARDIFGFATLSIQQLLMSILPALVLLVLLEKVKGLWQRQWR